MKNEFDQWWDDIMDELYPNQASHIRWIARVAWNASRETKRSSLRKKIDNMMDFIKSRRW